MLDLQKYSVLSGFDQHFTNTSSPGRLVLQIVTLQVFYYAIAFILMLLTSFLIGQPFDPSWVFSWKPVTLDNSLGLTLITLWLFDALLCVVVIMLVVGRSKLAWDFAVTVHVLNLIFAWAHQGFPESLGWWSLQILSCALMVGLGTYTTRWKELRDTFFDGIVDAELGQSTAMITDTDSSGQPSVAMKSLDRVAMEQQQ